MIYLDNAATTFPKPNIVKESTINSFGFCANPGRSGHKLSIRAAEEVYNCREKVSNFFGSKIVENVIFTPSCTYALNTVIKGVLEKGDHVVISSLEHNAVTRPLEKLKAKGIISYSVVDVFPDDDERTFNSFRENINKNTKLVICTHASNVFGIKLPIERIAALCRYYGILFCVDAAQTAGVFPIDVTEMGIDFLCVPGHKGLYGNMGIGALVINTDIIPDSLCEGGTGSGSHILSQPEILPDKFESGTVNLSGIASLRAGISFVERKTVKMIYGHELKVINILYNELIKMSSIELYTKSPVDVLCAPLLSFNIKEMNSEEVAEILSRKYNIAVRAGLHCSPLAHNSFGTEDKGTVRVAPSAFTTEKQIYSLISALKSIKK